MYQGRHSGWRRGTLCGTPRFPRRSVGVYRRPSYRQAAPTCASDNGKRSIDFTVLQGNSAIEMILVSNDARHFFVGRHAPIWREMINESRQVVA
jgi:hypothetical protein